MIKARLYIRTPYFTKCIGEESIPETFPTLTIYIQKPISALDYIAGLKGSSTQMAEFKRVGHDKVNDEYIYVNKQ